jgi:hypothetical protein
MDSKEVRFWLFSSDRVSKILLLRGDVVDTTPDGTEYKIALHSPWNSYFEKDTIWIKTSNSNFLVEFSDSQHPSKIEPTRMVKQIAHEILGSPCFGSKTDYRRMHPDRDPIFNAKVLYQREDGMLQCVWEGDLEMTECKPSLVKLSDALSTNIYIYRESTVNNRVLNGARFPYENWTAAVEYGQFKTQEK